MFEDRVIRPGPGCPQCGGVYGQHRKGCTVPTENARREREMDETRGTELLRAIEARDAARVGRILRMGT